MEHHRDKAQETINNAIANGATPKDALRMAKNYLLAGRRAHTQFRAELEGSPAAQTV